MTTYIIPTSTAEHIARNLVGKEDFEVVFTEGNKEGKRRFPDGEVYTRIPRIDEIEGRVVVLHSRVLDPNAEIIELETILDVLQSSETDKKRINAEVFFTYFSYGKQDLPFQKGESNIALDIVNRIMTYYFVDTMYTIDAHFVGRRWTNDFNIINTTAANLLQDSANADYPEENILYIGPDAGSRRRSGLRSFNKVRMNSYLTKIQGDQELREAVRGRIVGVVDDIIETGGTMAGCYDVCMGYGAKEVIALATHGVLESGIRRVKEKFSKLYLSNTIDRPEANVDVTGIVASTIKYERAITD